MQVEQLTEGQEFSPYKLFYGIFIPECLMAYRGLTCTAKCVWGTLARRAGKNTSVSPSQGELADMCGISRSTCISALQELEKQHFIVSEGQREIKRYTFLLHPVLLAAVSKKSGKKPASETDKPCSEISQPLVANSDKPLSENTTSLVANSDKPCSEFGQLYNNEFKSTEKSTEKSNSNREVADDKSPLKTLIDCYLDTVQRVCCSPNDNKFAQELIARSDYDFDIVEATIKYVKRHSSSKINSLTYFRDSINEALIVGRAPEECKEGNYGDRSSSGTSRPNLPNLTI